MIQYNKIANEYKSGEKAILKEYVIKPTFLRLAKKIKNKSVIDLACGSGYSTRLLKELGANRITGVDVSVEEIKLAKKEEEKEKEKINYITGDVATFDFSKLEKFDFATAVFLLSYAKTQKEMERFCNNIYQVLGDGGSFITINSNPDFPLQTNKKYEVTSAAIKSLPLKNGDIRRITYFSNGKESCSFDTYYWEKEIYEKCLTKAGFKDIIWHPVVISEEGIKKFGKDFWQDFIKKPYIAGLTCNK